jgi:Predicted AAA-ATPase
MKKSLPVGLSDFKIIVEEGFYYVDKTLLIRDLIRYGGIVTLLSRPRRFGKTLNQSMLRYFFEKSDEKTDHLFYDKKIWQEEELFSLLQGEAMQQKIDEGLIYPGIEQNPLAVWSLLLYAGYLTFIETQLIDSYDYCQLKIPNLEMRHIFHQLIS